MEVDSTFKTKVFGGELSVVGFLKEWCLDYHDNVFIILRRYKIFQSNTITHTTGSKIAQKPLRYQIAFKVLFRSPFP